MTRPDAPDPHPILDADEDRDVVEFLADEYVARHRRGESPTIEEYADRCPDRAEEIRSLFPAIATLERLKHRPTARPDRSSLLRERLGEFRLIREIGRGGMGIVYEAEQEPLARRVAVKILPKAPFEDESPMRRFLREAKTAASLRHPNIVPVFSIGEDNGLHYYVMPLIPGLGLDRVLRALRRSGPSASPDRDAIRDDSTTEAASILARTLIDGSFSPSPEPADAPTEPDWIEETTHKPRHRERSGESRPLAENYWKGVARIGVQVAGALQHAHDRGVLHRDIKPANLILDRSGGVWVTDFGLAKALGTADLSRTGDFVGTLRYMAPERLRGDSDARSDVYSLGLTLYEFLALRPAHDAPDGAELIRKIADDLPAPPRSINPDVPIDLETVVLKAISPDPALRYPTAAALADDLNRFLDGLPILGRRPRLKERLGRWVARSPALAILSGTSAVLGVVAAVFFTLFLLAPPRGPRPGPDPLLDPQAIGPPIWDDPGARPRPFPPPRRGDRPPGPPFHPPGPPPEDFPPDR